MQTATALIALGADVAGSMTTLVGSAIAHRRGERKAAIEAELARRRAEEDAVWKRIEAQLAVQATAQQDHGRQLAALAAVVHDREER